MSRNKTIRIGLSARLFHPRHGATGIESKTLQVLEQSIALTRTLAADPVPLVALIEELAVHFTRTTT